MYERLYEDTSCVILQKPAGIAVTKVEKSPVPSIEAAFPAWRPVHRLDNWTSGCLLLAKNVTTYAELRQQFQGGTIEKTYLALVIGLMPKNTTISSPLAHHPSRPERMVVVRAGTKHRGKPQVAKTRALALEHYHPNAHRRDPMTLVRIQIDTGVRHQIRLHLASSGYPIVGDALYGHKQGTTDHARHLLHAQRLALMSPDTQERLEILAPLPDDFLDVATRLGITLDALR